MIPSNLHAEFPLLGRSQNGHPLTYLDSANTALTPESVIEAMNQYYREFNANIHRGIYPISEEATRRHEQARENVRDFLNAKASSEIIFTRNATEGINLIANTWGRTNLRAGDGVLLSIMEHHSNIVPWQILQKENGFTIHFVELDEEGRINRDQYSNILKNENIKMVGIIHQSNTLGTINPVKEMIAEAKQHGAVVLVDAAQSVVHMNIDLQDMQPDFLVFTGHKLYGPTGIGVLYGREELLEALPPFLGGGEMIRTVTREGSTWNDLPYKFEAGTPNIAGAIGLGAALDFVKQIGIEAIHQHEQQLLKELLERLCQVEGIKIFGPKSVIDRGATVSFALDGLHPHDIASILGDKGVCVRAGNHCAQPLMEYLGVPATTRVSLALYNTSQDIDRLIEGLAAVQQLFHR